MSHIESFTDIENKIKKSFPYLLLELLVHCCLQFFELLQLASVHLVISIEITVEVINLFLNFFLLFNQLCQIGLRSLLDWSLCSGDRSLDSAIGAGPNHIFLVMMILFYFFKWQFFEVPLINTSSRCVLIRLVAIFEAEETAWFRILVIHKINICLSNVLE